MGEDAAFIVDEDARWSPAEPRSPSKGVEMYDAARRVQPPGPQGRTVPAESRPPILGMPRSLPEPMPPPRRPDPREALRDVKEPASARRRETSLIAGLVAAGVVALVLHSTGVDGLPFRSPAPAEAREALAVTAIDPAREARELRELRLAAAVAAAGRDARAPEEESAPSAPRAQPADEPSGSGSTESAPADNGDSTLLEDPTAVVEDSADTLVQDSTTLLEDSTTLLEDSASTLLEESESVALDPALP